MLQTELQTELQRFLMFATGVYEIDINSTLRTLGLQQNNMGLELFFLIKL